MVYTAAPINCMSFMAGESAAAEMSRSEIELVRAEERVLCSPNATSVQRAVLRFEAMASLRLDGFKVDLADLLRLEAAQQQYPHYESTNEMLRKLMAAEGLADKPGLLEVFRYMQTIEWISRVFKPGSVILPKTLLHIRTRCLFGPVPSSGNVTYRNTDGYSEERQYFSKLYIPPPPSEIPALIEDYCNFINRDLFNPVAQAGISHFQLESIKPFENKLDNTERAMSHVIFYRRGLLRSIVAPLGVGPALATEAHARYLLPYHVGHPVDNVKGFINSGSLFKLCAYYTSVAAQVINLYLDTIDNLEARWRSKLGKLKKDSTAELLLHALPGMPLVTVNSAMKLVNRGFSATNDALRLFYDAGIVGLTHSIQKNRAFVAQEAINIFDKVEHRVIPGNPVARDTIVKV